MLQAMLTARPYQSSATEDVGSFETGDMGVSKNGGTQQPFVFPLKMIILGCFGGTTI